MRSEHWYQIDGSRVVEALKTNVLNGISPREATKRLTTYGYNQLAQRPPVSSLKIFISQFSDLMVLILIGAALISGLLGEYADGITILAIVSLNAVLGFIQEHRAEKSMEALKKLAAPEATVVRDGMEIRIPAKEVVVGDILLLNPGDKVAADIRLLEAYNLEVEESLLTGESFPIRKKIDPLTGKELPLGDRFNMAYLGTSVTKGRGRGVVVATGMKTEMGMIAEMMEGVEVEETPLQRRLAQLGTWLVISCLLICAVVVATGIIRGEPIYQMFMAGVSLAVAAIPEGLPAIVTVALAVGVQKMVRRNSIVRKLPAVETLGCATVICSDKTGTLTKNEMTIRKIYCAGELFSVTGDGYGPQGEILNSQGRQVSLKGHPLGQLLKTAALCNNASLMRNGIQLGGLFRNKKRPAVEWSVIGDPTEGALMALAGKGNYWREVLEREEKRIEEFPFDSERKMMSVITESKEGNFVYSKGALDVILRKCQWIMVGNRVQSLTEQLRQEILEQNIVLAGNALRVIGLAYGVLEKNVDFKDAQQVERNLIFLGLAGMVDPPRPAAVEAIRICKEAGIQPIMITGDHQLTAEAIAQEMNFPLGQTKTLTGPELDDLDDEGLLSLVDSISVYARVSPKHKLRIVKALKKRGHVVAMTGDGVNDGPAIKEADIGIAMGKTGTDVTKEASSMILADDDFATIVAAIEEGRVIYDNIRKFIRYLLSCNTGEVMTMFLAALVGLPLPLLPIQILWVNLVTDGLPAMALGVEKGEPDIMKKSPRHPKENIFSGGLAGKILLRGIQIGLSTLLVFAFAYYFSDGNLILSRTMAFTTLVFTQLFHVFDCRSERYSPFALGFFGNKYLILAVLLSVAMQMGVIYLPFFQGVFKTTALNGFHWLIILFVAGGRTFFAGLYHLLSIITRRKPVYQ